MHSGPIASAHSFGRWSSRWKSRGATGSAPSAAALRRRRFHALPLKAARMTCWRLLIGSTRRDLVELEASMLRTAVVVAVSGILDGDRV